MLNENQFIKLKELSNYTNVPFWIYKNAEIQPLNKDFTETKILESFLLNVNINEIFSYKIFTFNELELYFVYKTKQEAEATFLIGGPTLLSLSTRDFDAKHLSFFNQIKKEEIQKMLSMLSRHTLFTFSKLLSLTSTIFDDSVLELDDLLHTHMSIDMTKRIDKDFQDQVYIWREANNRYDEFNNEKLLLSIVEKGNTEMVENIMKRFSFETSSKLSDNLLSHYKYESVCMVTLITRAAISGGLNINEAFPLSDMYIKRIDTTQTLFETKALIHRIMFDFTNRVSKSKKASLYSKTIMTTITYINKNLHYHISLEEIANEINITAKYLSQKFINEVGMSITNYIQKQRISEAAELLKFTKQSLAEISNTLCFHSQSYFNQIFKKHMDISPKKYREINTTF